MCGGEGLKSCCSLCVRACAVPAEMHRHIVHMESDLRSQHFFVDDLACDVGSMEFELRKKVSYEQLEASNAKLQRQIDALVAQSQRTWFHNRLMPSVQVSSDIHVHITCIYIDIDM